MLTANEARVIKNDYLLFQVLEQIKKMAMQGESKVYFFTENVGKPSDNYYSGVIKLNEGIINSLKNLGYNVERTSVGNKYCYNTDFFEVSF